MKRTGEVILTTTALFFTYLGTILISTVLLFSNLDEIRNLFQEDYMSEEALPVTLENINVFLNIFISLRWVVLLTVIIGTVLGTFALYYFVRDKNSRAASIFSIVAAVIIPLGTLLTGFIPALLFLVAGIMGLMRKTPSHPHPVETNL